MSEFVSGIIGGFTGIVLCHPVTTLKTRIQTYDNYKPFSDLHKNGLRSLYIGISAPLIGMMLEKSVLFASYDKIKRVTEKPALCGLLAGINTTMVVTPFERVMIVSQTRKITSIDAVNQIIKRDGFRTFYRGYSMTLFREVPGYAVYFSVYEFLKKYNCFHSTVIGATCGVSAWAVIYPSDPVKTMMQERDISAKSAIKLIYERAGLRGFYIGLPYALLRASILHAGVITGYETSKTFLKN